MGLCMALSAKEVLMASPVFLTFLEIGSKLVSVSRVVNVLISNQADKPKYCSDFYRWVPQ